MYHSLEKFRNSVTSNRIAYLDNFRAVTMLMVVGIHATGYAGLDMTHDVDRFLDFLVRTMALQSFFFVDGYLFASKHNTPFTYRLYLTKSTKRILLPWLIFSGIYFLARIAFESRGFFSENLILGRSLGDIAICFYASRMAQQIYFLLSLFIVRTLSFALYRLSFAPSFIMVLAFICYATIFRTFIIHVPHLQGDPIFAAAGGMQYYLLGIVFYKYRDTIRRFSGHIVALSVFAIILYTAVDHSGSWVPNRKDFLVKCFYLIGTYCFIMVLTKSRSRNIVSSIGTHTMEIFLLHQPIMMKAVTIVVFAVLSNRLAGFAIIMMSSYFGSFLLGMIIQRFPYGSLLFGRASPSYNSKP